MSRGRVFVQIADGKPIRIFRHESYAAIYATGDPDAVQQWPRKDATGAIRKQVYDRSGHECSDCGKPVTESQAHMHEKILRSKGGEISLENSIIVCYNCHMGRKDSRHPERQLRFGESG